MFPASFFKNIKNKIMPDIMEVIYSTRTEFDSKIDKLLLDISKNQEHITMLAGEIADLNTRLKKLEILSKKTKKVKSNGK